MRSVKSIAMQCPSCHFENMPGVSNCGRCGAALNLGSAAVNVYPPRARRWARPFRRFFYFFTRTRYLPAGWLEGRAGKWAAKGADMLRDEINSFKNDRIPWRIVMRMALPGWPQLFLSRRLQGRIFLCGFLTFMPLGLFFAGTGLGGFFMGLALALHAASIIDIVIFFSRQRDSRLVYSLACMILVGTVLYFPAAWLITRVAVAQQFQRNADPFLAGDVILYNPSAYRRTDPQVGEIVMYRLPYAHFDIPNPGGHGHAIYDFTGQIVAGRVLASPGQKLAYEKGQLKVDGRLSPWSQSVPAQFFTEGLNTTMPDGQYYILSGFTPTAQELRPEILSNYTFVPRGSILGRVYFRTHPLGRFGAIR
jgi:hypothetical protein